MVVELPESGQAHYRLGRFYQSQSRKSEALAAFTASAERAVIVGRDSLYETIAALRVGEGEFTGAIAAYRLELDVNPNNAAAHRRLGDLYTQDGRLGESLAEVRSVAVDRPCRRRRPRLAGSNPASPLAVCRCRSRRTNCCRAEAGS